MSTLWHLALECSSTGGSAALLEITASAAQPRLHSQIILPSDRGSVCTLSPSIDGLLRGAELAPEQLESLSVTAGPGSFTGLRVGMSTAKMLAMACRKPVVPVDTMAAIAERFQRSLSQLEQSSRNPIRLVTAINAFRKQVFTASWFIDSSGATNLRASCVVDAEEWLADPWGPETPAAPSYVLAAAAQSPDEIWISGAGLALYAPAASARYHLAPEEHWQPLAEDVGRLGWRAHQHGQSVTAAELAPNYIRSSAAEEKRRASGQP